MKINKTCLELFKLIINPFITYLILIFFWLPTWMTNLLTISHEETLIRPQSSLQSTHKKKCIKKKKKKKKIKNQSAIWYLAWIKKNFFYHKNLSHMNKKNPLNIFCMKNKLMWMWLATYIGIAIIYHSAQFFFIYLLFICCYCKRILFFLLAPVFSKPFHRFIIIYFAFN